MSNRDGRDPELRVSRSYLRDLNPVRQSERRAVPERKCFVCLEGIYVTQSGKHSPFGAPKPPWHVEACNRCGHVQIFRPDWKETP